MHCEMIEIGKITKAIASSAELLRQGGTTPQQALDSMKEAEVSLNMAIGHILTQDRSSQN